MANRWPRGLIAVTLFPRTLTLILVAALVLSACQRQESSDSRPPQVNSTDPHWVIQHEPRAHVALVFVHGIFGDTLGTWTHSPGTSFFSLIEQDSDMGPNVDMLAFGYTSRMIGSGSFDIQEAANRLHVRLDHHGVLGYPAIVFVAHSMGGLVVLRELLTHRELLPKVPVIVLYATPQEGAQITKIARNIANNPALEQMLPADRNGYLRVLNDEWQALPASSRPRVRCAYEKRPTYGNMIVPWSSATRFCEGTTLAVDADHLQIVKPDRPGHDSVVLLASALKEFVLGKHLVAKLETPDFIVEDDHSVFTLGDAFHKRDARLVNAGGTKLRYWLTEFPDQALNVWPDQGPKEIPANTTAMLQFGLPYGAADSERRFILKSDVAPDQPVLVRVQNFPAIRAQQLQLAHEVGRDLARTLSDPQQLERLKRASSDDVGVADAIVRVVAEGVERRVADIAPEDQVLLSAELLNAFNWPTLAVRALRTAEREQPSIVQFAAIQRVAGVAAGLSGETRVFTSVDTKVSDPTASETTSGTNPLTDARLEPMASQLVNLMQQVPALAAAGLSLGGDIQRVRGDLRAAEQSFSKAAAIRATPSVSRRLNDVRRTRRNSEGVGSEGR